MHQWVEWLSLQGSSISFIKGISMLESLSPPNVPQMLLLAIMSHVSFPHCNTAQVSA